MLLPLGSATSVSLISWLLESASSNRKIQRKPWDLNPQRLCTAPVFETGSSSSRMTSEYVFDDQIHAAAGTNRLWRSCGGRNRTCVRAVNSRLPVPARDPPHHFTPPSAESAWSDSNRRSPGPEPGGLPSFPTRCVVHRGSTGVDGVDSPRELKSAQRELNPHIRHGKAVGYRYIMGADRITRLSKIKLLQSTGWDSNPRCRITNAESSPLNDQC